MNAAGTHWSGSRTKSQEIQAAQPEDGSRENTRRVKLSFCRSTSETCVCPRLQHLFVSNYSYCDQLVEVHWCWISQDVIGKIVPAD